MTRYILSEKNYLLLRAQPLFMDSYQIEFDDNTFSFCVSDIRELLIDLDYMISLTGMDETQNECTEYGRKLYDLYDQILEVHNNAAGGSSAGIRRKNRPG